MQARATGTDDSSAIVPYVVLEIGADGDLTDARTAWGNISLIVAGVIAALGCAAYLFAAAIGLLASAVAALAAEIVLRAEDLAGCAIGILVLMALGGKK